MPDKKVLERSVTAEDHDNKAGAAAGALASFFGHPDFKIDLPAKLPIDHYQRDKILYFTTEYDPKWSDAVRIAASESGRRKPQIFSKFQNRQQAAEMVVKSAALGLGWDQYINGLRRHYVLTNNGWYAEVVRASKSPSSPIIGLIQLHSLRCYRTGNALKPVEYMDSTGRVHALEAHQVIFGADSPDPLTGYGECAAESVYDLIFARCAMQRHLNGRITGQDISELEFISGSITTQDINDAMDNARLNQRIAANQSKNSSMGQVKNKIVIPVIGDRVTGHTVKLAGLPENYTREDVDKYADLEYAKALFVDPQQLNPDNVARANLSSNSAAMAEANENRGDGLFSQQIETMHDWVFGSQVDFRIFFRDFKADRTKAELDQLHISNADALGLQGQQRIEYLEEKEVIPAGFMTAEVREAEEIEDDPSTD